MDSVTTRQFLPIDDSCYDEESREACRGYDGGD